jgi:colanic acid biosynthesis glycosyl transferase WcaI
MRILILNQAFFPDVVSTAQHASDLAVEAARKGDDVIVICSRRGYDSPQLQFAPYEVWQGVKIRRVSCLGLSKKSKLGRILVFASFLFNCLAELVRVDRVDCVVGMTSPPLLSFLAALSVKLRGGRFIYWVMDLNPDEAIAAGWLRDSSLTATFLKSVLHFSLRHAAKIVVLDRFMKARIESKNVPSSRMTVIPPWPHDTAVAYNLDGRSSFRAKHGLSEKFLVMYSGNHSPCHPLDTLLKAAELLSSHEEIAFCFIGGGSEFCKVQRFASERALTNVLCLPYQPLEMLSSSLSAADMHAVVLGNEFVGIVHPCKIYNILSLGIPVLYIGPRTSHITDMLPPESMGKWAFAAGHGEPDLVAAHIRYARAQESTPGAHRHLLPEFSQARLVSQLYAVLEPATDSVAQSASPDLVSK